MKQIIIFLGSVLMLFGAMHSAQAQDILINTETILAEESVSFTDLGVEEPALLPSSRFYFFKNFTRGVKRFFTFDPIKKAELELRFADEKIAETKKLAEKEPKKTEAIERAIENYRASQGRLKSRFESLRETSQNPRVDKLLEKLADRTVKHEKLFAELKEKFEDQKELGEKIDAVREKMDESIVEAAKKDDAEKFAKKLEKTFIETKGGDFKHVRSLEILDRIHKKAPEELKEKLTEIRGDFIKRFQEDIEAFEEKHKSKASELIKKTLEDLPGDKARRLVIIEEIREQAETHVRKALEEAGEVIEKTFEEHEELAERAAEAIRHAAERIEKLEVKLKDASLSSASIKRLAENARARLKEARAALENKKYGKAFGMARSAEVLVRNALRMLEETEETEDEDLREDMIELEKHLNEWEHRLESLNKELQPKAKEAFDNSRLHLRLAQESIEKGALREAKKHYEEAERFERLIERIFREPDRRPENMIAPRQVMEATTPLTSCEEVKKNIIKLDERLKQGTIDENDYKEKQDILRRKLAACKEMSPAFPKPSTKPVPIAPPTPSLSRCGEFERQIIALKEHLGKGKLSKEDFLRKMEILQQELSKCVRGNTNPVHAPAESAKPDEGIICTQEYNPVCGADGKTYSNSCFIKTNGVEVKYRGECAKPLEESAAIQPPAPATIICISCPAPLAGCSYVEGTCKSCGTLSCAESAPAAPTTSKVVFLKIESDDNGFYPQNLISVPKGARINLIFAVRSEKVYYGGLDFRSSKFKTETVKPGGTTSTEFTADETFKITSYWPLTDTSKAVLTIEVK